jgi:bifunctional non-homologous end joining protein LigD
VPRSTMTAGFIEPMLPTLVDEAPDGDAWVHEIKYDRYRTQLAVNGKRTRAFTRNVHDWTEKYAPVITSATALRCRSAIIDGEMCVQNAAGITDLKAIKSAIKSAPNRLVLFAFDLQMLNGSDLRAEALLDRRKPLKEPISMA